MLVLVDGGPGCGKTKATNTLAQALELVGVTAAYTGSTGTAATNYPGGFTLHGMMGFGFDTRAGVGFRKFYTKDTTRRKVKKRLGNNQAKKILLVIDEISALSYSVQFASTLGWSVVRRGLGRRHTSRFVNSRMSVHSSPPILGAFRVSSILVCRGFVFAKTETALRHVFNSTEPFGGVNVVLVGDFDQKLPVEKGSSLAQILVNQHTYEKRRIDSKGAKQQHAAKLFAMFQKYEMTKNHRLDESSTDQTRLKGYLRKMRDTSIEYPITRGFLESLPQLHVPSEMSEAERAAWRKDWQFAPVLVTGNATRQSINEFKAIEYGKVKNLPILTFYNTIPGVDDYAMENISDKLQLTQPIKRYFVQGAPAVLTANIKGKVPAGLVNGAKCVFRSLTWNECDLEDPNVKAWHNNELEGGKIYRVLRASIEVYHASCLDLYERIEQALSTLPPCYQRRRMVQIGRKANQNLSRNKV